MSQPLRDSGGDRVSHDAGAALAGLQLSPDELQALARQGFVRTERRGSRSYYKLQFQFDGKRRFRYLGSDPVFVEAVREELAELQRSRCLERELRIALRRANESLREAKRIMEPVVRSAGYSFHGYAIRRCRASERVGE